LLLCYCVSLNTQTPEFISLITMRPSSVTSTPQTKAELPRQAQDPTGSFAAGGTKYAVSSGDR